MTKRRASRPRPYCDDWSCPAHWTCARSWARAMEYWRFDPEADEREGVSLYKGPRNPHRAACEDFEKDVPREWLKDIWTAQVPDSSPRPAAPWRPYVVWPHQAGWSA